MKYYGMNDKYDGGTCNNGSVMCAILKLVVLLETSFLAVSHRLTTFGDTDKQRKG